MEETSSVDVDAASVPENLPGKSESNLEIPDTVSQPNDAANILVAAAHSDVGDVMDEDDPSKASDGIKNKFSKWKNKATSLYEDNNSIAKIKKMGNALEVKSGFKMGIKMGSNALGNVVHAVMPHGKNPVEEGKAGKDKRALKGTDSSSTVSAVTTTHSEPVPTSAHGPMSDTLNSALLNTAVGSSHSSSSSHVSSSSDEDSDSSDDSEDDSHSDMMDAHHNHTEMTVNSETSNLPVSTTTPSQSNSGLRITTARSEADLESLVSPSPSSPSLIRGRYATPSSAKVPPKKKSSLEQSVATITTGIAAMSAFSSGQTPSNTSLSNAHFSSQASDSSIVVASYPNLPPGQYGVTVGPGMLGVHLKQSYWPAKGGIYIDSIVPGGYAEKSRVMMIGDTILKVGDVDVSKGTVAEVPKVIGRARRPVLLVCTGDFPVDSNMMDPLTTAIGIVNKLREQNRNTNSSLPKMANTDPVDVIPPIPAIAFKESGHEKRAISFDSVLTTDSPILVNSHQEVASSPLKERVQSVPNFQVDGCNTHQHLINLSSKRSNQAVSLTTLSKAVQNDPEFREILRQAFITCCLDSRRLPFYAQYLTNEDALGLEAVSANVRLMAYTELLTFKDLYSVSPNSKKTEYAKRIAYKFFLRNPNFVNLPKDPNESFDETAPMFDLRPIFDPSSLQELEAVIQASVKKSVPKSLFQSFEASLESSLTGVKFASFLVSDECARMRAYLRGTNPYVNAPLEVVYRSLISGSSYEKICAHNHLVFMILYLICQNDNEPDTKTDSSVGCVNKVPLSSLGRLFAPIFIHRSLIPAIDHFNSIYEGQCSDPKNITVSSLRQLFELLDQFWQTFIAEVSGMVEGSIESKEAQAALHDTRKHIMSLVDASNKELAEDVIDPHMRLARLQIVKLRKSLNTLSDELLYEHAITFNRKYKEHMIHEWMCGEAKKSSVSVGAHSAVDVTGVAKNDVSVLPPLAPGCVTRLMRRVELPKGVSRHRPLRSDSGRSFDSNADQINAECAIIFGSCNNTEDDLTSSTAPDDTRIIRYATVALKVDDNGTGDYLTDDNLPSTLESYAVTPPLKTRSFSRLLDHNRVSADGWEVSLVTFVVPKSNKSDALDDNIYGVSLVIRRSAIYPPTLSETLELNQAELETVKWSDMMKDRDDAVVGIMLLCRKNVLPAMRKTLSDFYADITTSNALDQSSNPHICTPLVNLLGAFQNNNTPASLKIILEKYLVSGSKTWLGQQIDSQSIAFDKAAADLLVSSLPPIPLALLFISALLEQKIVFSSCRRSVLVSVTIALKNLLSPLNWTHLFVPVVPPALANDLVQYPAPFILGIPVEDKGSLQLLNALPPDVTLVDLDVGRVILAKNISYDSELVKAGRDSNAIVSALRSQILYLAEAVGSVFASCIHSDAWLCDGPSIKQNHPFILSELVSRGIESNSDKVAHICHSFIDELLEGSNTCSFWIREAADESGRKSDQETSILFDEHRFFHLKNLRATSKISSLFADEKIRSRIYGTEERKKSLSSSLALTVDSYDLVLETFVRGQGMSSYLSSSTSTESAFW